MRLVRKLVFFLLRCDCCLDVPLDLRVGTFDLFLHYLAAPVVSADAKLTTWVKFPRKLTTARLNPP